MIKLLLLLCILSATWAADDRKIEEIAGKVVYNLKDGEHELAADSYKGGAEKSKLMLPLQRYNC